MPGSEKLSYEELERQNRILKARIQEQDEQYDSSFDAEGVGGRTAVVILRDKNAPYVYQLIDLIPEAVHWKHPMFPEMEEVGLPGAIRYAQTYVQDAISAVFPLYHHPLMGKQHHAIEMWLQKPKVKQLARPDAVGVAARTELKQAVSSLAVAATMRRAFGLSKETEILPVEAERRAAWRT